MIFSLLRLSKPDEYRRLSCDLTLYYNKFNNLTPWSPSEYVNVSMPPYSLHSVYHDFNIRKPMCQNNSFEHDFFNRCVSAWNSLPSSLVKSKYVASFKNNFEFEFEFYYQSTQVDMKVMQSIDI